MARAANSTETADDTQPAKVVGRPFQPGESGNPLGRPKGIARYVREKAGTNGELMVDLLMTAMGGWLPEGGHDPLDAQGRVKLEKVPTAERIAAARTLIERGFGKAPAFAPIEDDDPLDLKNEQELHALAAELDVAIDDLSVRRQRRERAKPKPRPKRAPRKPRAA